MSWFTSIKDEIPNVVGGLAFGLVRATTGISCYTSGEVDEIDRMKRLSESTIQHSPLVLEDGVEINDYVLESIKLNREGALFDLLKELDNLSPEQQSLIAIIAAKTVCRVALKNARFHEILADACVNLLVV